VLFQKYTAATAHQTEPVQILISGGFAPGAGIYLNQNTSKMTLGDSLSHELIHAYDECTVKLDWNNINHQACTEIRANALSGECRLTREILRGHTGFTKHFQDCVKRRAILGVSASGWTKRQAQDAVNGVWDNCFYDYAPYDEIY
jgi:mitochondrial inner membrane protease ATP23